MCTSDKKSHRKWKIYTLSGSIVCTFKRLLMIPTILYWIQIQPKFDLLKQKKFDLLAVQNKFQKPIASALAFMREITQILSLCFQVNRRKSILKNRNRRIRNFTSDKFVHLINIRTQRLAQMLILLTPKAKEKEAWTGK